MSARHADELGDPIDLVLAGDFDNAIARYVSLYLDALREGDRYIGSDLCGQLLYCVAAKEERAAEDAVGEVRALLEREIERAELQVDRRFLEDDLEAARAGILTARERADRSVERVEAEKGERWRD